VSRTAFYGTVPTPAAPPLVAVVTAGTSDIAVSREAARTLVYHGVGCEEINDVGVAGLWRLLERVEELRRFSVLIVTAGMDAALPSVIAGLVPGLVIAVPVRSAMASPRVERRRYALHWQAVRRGWWW